MITKKISNNYNLSRARVSKKIKNAYKLNSSTFEESFNSIYLKKVIYRCYLKKDSDVNFSVELPITSFQMNSNKIDEVEYSHTQQVKIPLPENYTSAIDVIKARTLDPETKDEFMQVEREVYKSDDTIVTDVISAAYIKTLRFSVDALSNVGIVDSEINLSEMPSSFQTPKNKDIKHIFSYNTSNNGEAQFIVSEKDLVLPLDNFKANGGSFVCTSSSITINNYKTTNIVNGI